MGLHGVPAGKETATFWEDLSDNSCCIGDSRTIESVAAGHSKPHKLLLYKVQLSQYELTSACMRGDDHFSEDSTATHCGRKCDREKRNKLRWALACPTNSASGDHGQPLKA